MNNKHIYKYSLEASFFDLLTSINEVTKDTDSNNNPIIKWVENEDSTISWTYDNEKERDHDFDVLVGYRYKLMD